MLNNFIYAKKKSLFLNELEAGNVLDEAIVFIEDTKEIWNHGTYFDCSSVDLSSYNTKEEIAAELVNYAKANAIDTMAAYVAEQLADKQDKVIKFTNKTASSWVSDNTYADYSYRCDVPCDGVTAEMYAEVVFDVEHSTSGNYAPICETKANVVSVWSSEDTTITIPTIIITK